jgi:hypothetical protein
VYLGLTDQIPLESARGVATPACYVSSLSLDASILYDQDRKLQNEKSILDI